MARESKRIECTTTTTSLVPVRLSHLDRGARTESLLLVARTVCRSDALSHALGVTVRALWLSVLACAPIRSYFAECPTAVDTIRPSALISALHKSPRSPLTRPHSLLAGQQTNQPTGQRLPTKVIHTDTEVIHLSEPHSLHRIQHKR